MIGHRCVALAALQRHSRYSAETCILTKQTKMNAYMTSLKYGKSENTKNKRITPKAQICENMKNEYIYIYIYIHIYIYMYEIAFLELRQIGRIKYRHR